MEQEIHYHVGLGELFVDSVFSIDEVFNDSTEYLFVRNQEEKDYYSGLQLMYGKTLIICTVDDYVKELSIARDDPYFAMPWTYYATYPNPFKKGKNHDS